MEIELEWEHLKPDQLSGGIFTTEEESALALTITYALLLSLSILSLNF